MDPWCCDTYEETLIYFRDPGTILCGKCSDTEGINSIPVWGIPNINMRFKANRLHRVTEIILRFWEKFHMDSREISLRLSSYQDEVSGRSRIYMEISSLYCLRCSQARKSDCGMAHNILVDLIFVRTVNIPNFSSLSGLVHRKQYSEDISI